MTLCHPSVGQSEAASWTNLQRSQPLWDCFSKAACEHWLSFNFVISHHSNSVLVWHWTVGTSVTLDRNPTNKTKFSGRVWKVPCFCRSRRCAARLCRHWVWSRLGCYSLPIGCRPSYIWMLIGWTIVSLSIVYWQLIGWGSESWSSKY